MGRQLSVWMALLPVLVLIATGVGSIFVWQVGMHVPLLAGMVMAAVVALMSGWKWNDVQQMMVNGVARALPAVFILLVIGIIIGTWIAGGVIPTMIFYGLKFIHPDFFVPAVAIVTGLVSITLGSSFTSIATVGLAFMVIGEGLGFPPGLVAGAIISGAFFGDKLSPLSDTTNIAPAVAETDLFSHVKHMLWDTLPAFFIALVLYAILGQTSVHQEADQSSIVALMDGLQSIFTIHPLLLLMPVLTIILIVKRTPALPALLGVAILGAVLAITVQGETVTSVMKFMTSGYHVESGIEAVDKLLNKGGMVSMYGTIILLVLATGLGGIMEETGAFQVLTRKMLEKVKSTGSLIMLTIVSTFAVAFSTGAQFLAIILPARTFVHKYKELKIDTKNLSRCVEAAGTVGINLVPWGVPAVFAAGVLEVDPMVFIPYTFLAFLVPLINVVYGYTGWTISKKGDRRLVK